MGQKFSVSEYKKIKQEPERVIEMDLETINNYLFSFMLNDREDYSRLHKSLQEYGNMPPERLIISSRGKISLGPLLGNISNHDHRVEILSRISDFGHLNQEYYVRWPIEMSCVILKFIKGYRAAFDFNEQFRARFNLDYFTHNNVIGICKRIMFQGEYINREEDLLIEFLGDKIKDMFIYLRRHYPKNIPDYIVFKMIEGFFEESTRLAPTLNGTKVTLRLMNYPCVPVIPDEYLPGIIQEMIKEKKVENEIEAKAFLRIPECPVESLISFDQES